MLFSLCTSVKRYTVFSLQGDSQTLAHSINIWGLAIQVPRPHRQRWLFRKSELVLILVLRKQWFWCLLKLGDPELLFFVRLNIRKAAQRDCTVGKTVSSQSFWQVMEGLAPGGVPAYVASPHLTHPNKGQVCNKVCDFQWHYVMELALQILGKLALSK